MTSLVAQRLGRIDARGAPAGVERGEKGQRERHQAQAQAGPAIAPDGTGGRDKPGWAKSALDSFGIPDAFISFGDRSVRDPGKHVAGWKTWTGHLLLEGGLITRWDDYMLHI